jgi:hypothetical protein
MSDNLTAVWVGPGPAPDPMPRLHSRPQASQRLRLKAMPAYDLAMVRVEVAAPQDGSET